MAEDSNTIEGWVRREWRPIDLQGKQNVLLPQPYAYETLLNDRLDDSPWDAEEMDRLREEALDQLDRYGKFDPSHATQPS